jgi:hypothetical protein
MIDCNTYTLKAFNTLTNVQAWFYNMSYFISSSQRDFLKKDMGFSCPSLFFFSSATTMISLEEKENIKNYLA